MQLKRDLLRGLKSCFAITALLIANLAYPTIACSPAEDNYIPPTNLELVEMADAIVVGKIKGRGGRMSRSDDILVKPFALLKGEKLPEVILLDGWLVGESPYDLDYKVEAYYSAPYNITSHHPEAGYACSRYGFAKDMNLVMFLEKTDAGYNVIDPPLSRSLEDVPSLNAPWVKAVKHYITISRLPKNKHLQAMKNVAQYYRKQPPSLAAEVLADLFESEAIDCAEGYKNNKEKCQYFFDKFYAIADQGLANYETRKAKPAPYEPELLRSLSGLLLLFAFFATLIFLSFGKRSR